MSTPNINIITYPDIIYDESIKFLLINPVPPDLDTLINAISTINDEHDYTLYVWDKHVHELCIDESIWCLNTATQANKIYINMFYRKNMFYYLLGWKKTHWSCDSTLQTDADNPALYPAIVLLEQMNPRHVTNLVDILIEQVVNT